MFNYVRRSDGGPARHEGPRSEVDVIAALGTRLLGQRGTIDWEQLRDHAAIRQLIGRVVPGYGEIAGIDETSREFQIEGRTFHEPRFATAYSMLATTSEVAILPAIAQTKRAPNGWSKTISGETRESAQRKMITSGL